MSNHSRPLLKRRLDAAIAFSLPPFLILHDRRLGQYTEHIPRQAAVRKGIIHQPASAWATDNRLPGRCKP